MLKGIIIKVTSNCNLNCRYCGSESVAANVNAKTIEKESAIEFVDKILSFDPQLRHLQIIWHGGEPLLLDHEFFDEICTELADISRTYGTKITHHIQTNATLVSEDHCKILGKHNFKVGVSCDGPTEINDLYRIFPDGKRSFEIIRRNVKLLKKHGLDFGMLAVVTQKSVKYPDKIYDISKKLGAKGLKVNALKAYGRGADMKSPSPSEYSNFLKRLFDLWMNDTKVHGCLPLQAMVDGLLTGNVSLCTFKKEGCSEWLCLSPDGEVYPCGEFINNSAFRLGNVDEEVEKWFNSYGWKRLHICMKKKTEKCPNDCDYKPICYGGCTKRFLISGENDYCLKGVYDYILKCVEGI